MTNVAGWPGFPADPLGAFMRDNHIVVAGAATGPLAGRSFAAKDVFDIAGAGTGFGHPDWLRTNPVPTRTATAVQRLLDGGATLVGKTISDELCYSLTGMNHHYGAPANSRAPGRTVGGSSSGSAAAVAGGLVDVALGTDCGGSVRIPASYCGLYGIRTTHGRVPVDGVSKFAGSFDVVGWFAREAGLFATLGPLLLDAAKPVVAPKRLLLARDAFGLVDPAVRAETLRVVEAARPLFDSVEEVDVADVPLTDWLKVFQTIQAGEIWANLSNWIERERPSFGPGVSERLALAAQVTPEAIAAARRARDAIAARVQALLGDDAVLCLPSAPRIAPTLETPSETLELSLRTQAMSLLCIAGLCGLPQVSLPLCSLDDCPLGLSFIGARGADEQLLALAVALSA